MSVGKPGDKSWQQQADDLARKLRLQVEIARLSRPGMAAAEMAEQLPEDLRSLYWRGKLDAYFERELS
jgi:lipopolysaccharide biosynthesis protein